MKSLLPTWSRRKAKTVPDRAVHKGLAIVIAVIGLLSSEAYSEEGYVLDGFGGVHTMGGAPMITPATPYFGFDVARALRLTGDAMGYYVLDGFGGLHAGGDAVPIAPAPPYFGFDIAKDVQISTVDQMISFAQFVSTASLGTAPLVVNSPTKVANLNADLLDGFDSTTLFSIGSTLWVDDTGDIITGDLDVQGTVRTIKDNATSFRLRGSSDLTGDDGVADSTSQSYAGVFYNAVFNDTGGTGAKNTRVIYGSNEDMDLEIQGSNHIRITAVDDNVGTGRIRIAAEDEIQFHAYDPPYGPGGTNAETDNLVATIDSSGLSVANTVTVGALLMLPRSTIAPVSCIAANAGATFVKDNSGVSGDAVCVCVATTGAGAYAYQNLLGIGACP